MRFEPWAVLDFAMGRFRWALFAAALASIAAGACSVLLVTVINAALTSNADRAAPLAVAFGAVACLVMFTSMLANVMSERLRHRATAELRHYISSRVLGAPLRQIEEVGSAAVQAALSEHVTNVAQFFVSVPVLLTNGVIVLGCLMYLLILSPRVFLVTVPFIVLGSLGYHHAHLRAIRDLRAGAAAQDRLFEHFRALVDGAKELRLNHAKQRVFLDAVLGPAIDAVSRLRAKGMSLLVAASSGGNFLLHAFLGLVLFALAADLTDRARVLTGFALIMVYLVSPLQSLLLGIPNANLARVAAERIKDLSAALSPAEPAPPTTAPVEGFRRLHLRGVTHRYYHERQDVMFELGPIELDLSPGEITFVVGGNGSGKTTLAKLLVGLYAPERGSIWLDGMRVDADNRNTYRQLFSAVFSDYHLFDCLLDAPRDLVDARGNQLLAKLQLEHKVQLAGGAFTTRSLSHGQRKRLALVVACLEDRPVLVFDEWAADQDPVFKEVFYCEILRELRDLGKCVILISHDDRYFHLADRVLRMENGRIVAHPRMDHAGKPHLAPGR